MYVKTNAKKKPRSGNVELNSETLEKPSRLLPVVRTREAKEKYSLPIIDPPLPVVHILEAKAEYSLLIVDAILLVYRAF